MKKTLVSVSVFSGCLGFDLGLEAVGIHCNVFVEKDPHCRETIHLNRTRAQIFEDICMVKGEELKKAAGGQVDVLVGGPPCQSFSTIGKRGSFKDERGKLVAEYLRVLGEVSPTAFVMENVVGILSAQRNGKPLISWLLRQFKKLGYHVDMWVLDSLDFGVCQKRRRVIIVGSLNQPISKPKSRRLSKTLQQVIGDLELVPGECADFSPKMARTMKRVPEGGNWKSLKPRSRKKAMGNADLKSGGLTAFYRRLSYSSHSPTLLTSPTQRATTLCHPTQNRPLSVAEYARIQGFPDVWKLSGSTSQKYRQLGNAVPVGLGKAIGKSILASF